MTQPDLSLSHDFPKLPLSGYARIAMVAVLLVTLLYAAVFGWWYQKSVDDAKTQTLKEGQLLLQFHAAKIHDLLYGVVKDLDILAHASTPLLDKGLDSAEAIDEVVHTYSGFMAARKDYDQIRFLDLSGQEIVRLNYVADQVQVVAKEQLQNKANRYYFQDMLGLNAGETYLSRLDLNIENDQIELPFKPMLRIGLKVYRQDSAGVNQPQGMVLVNYLAKELVSLNLQQKRTLSKNHMTPELIDSKGYWLRADNSAKQWGFMLDVPDNRLSLEHPKLWAQMRAQPSGRFEMDEGLYLYEFVPATVLKVSVADNLLETYRLLPSQETGWDYGWYLLEFYPNHEFRHALISQWQKFWPIFVVLYFLLLVFAIAMGFLYQQVRLRQLRSQYYAFHDGLTGVFNRNAWKQRVHSFLSQHIAKKMPFVLVFIDVNDLKPINDTLGHEAGDEVLQIVAKRLQQAIRAEDCVLRMGGDEFMVILDQQNAQLETNSDRQYAAFFVEKFRAQFVQPLSLKVDGKAQAIPISLSYGFASFPQDLDGLKLEGLERWTSGAKQTTQKSALTESVLNHLLGLADQRMYQDKQGHKQGYSQGDNQGDKQPQNAK